VRPSFDTAVVLFGKTLVLPQVRLQLLGFFFTARADREAIAVRGNTHKSRADKQHSANKNHGPSTPSTPQNEHAQVIYMCSFSTNDHWCQSGQ